MYFHTPYTYLDFLEINPYSRPGRNRKYTRGIVIHWVNNVGTDEKLNRDFFNGLKYQTPTVDANGNKLYAYASANYIVGFKRIISTMNSDEESFHVGAASYTPVGKKLMEGCRSPNQSLLGIELCHPDATGKPDDYTYKLATSLAAEKLTQYGLNPRTDLYRHGDIVNDNWNGKVTPRQCHKYYMENPDAWLQFKADVERIHRENNPDYVPPEDAWKLNAMKLQQERGLITSPDWLKRYNDVNVPLWYDAVTKNRMYDHFQQEIDSLKAEVAKLRG